MWRSRKLGALDIAVVTHQNILLVCICKFPSTDEFIGDSIATNCQIWTHRIVFLYMSRCSCAACPVNLIVLLHFVYIRSVVFITIFCISLFSLVTKISRRCRGPVVVRCMFNMQRYSMEAEGHAAKDPGYPGYGHSGNGLLSTIGQGRSFRSLEVLDFVSVSRERRRRFSKAINPKVLDPSTHSAFAV